MNTILAAVLVLVLAVAARLHVTIWLPGGHVTVPVLGLVLAALAAAIAGLSVIVVRRVLEWPHVSGGRAAAVAWGMP